MDVLCCGMIGSKQGWQDAGYLKVPFVPSFHNQLVSIKTKNKKLNIFIVPGLKQNDPPDIMRGEETQALGIITKYNNFDGVVCFTGTHSKWVQIVGNEIISFDKNMFLVRSLLTLSPSPPLSLSRLGASLWLGALGGDQK